MAGFKVRDFRNKGFFLLDDDYLNGYARHLGTTASMVYISLCRHSDKEQKAFPSQKMISDELGINDRVVMRKIKLLEDWCIIKKEKTRNAIGKYLFNTYFLLDRSEWKEPPTQKMYMEPPTQKVQLPPTQNMYIKDTHKKETHINTIATPPNENFLEQKRRQNNRLAGKPYSKPEWLLSLSDKDIDYIQEEFPDMSVETIVQIGRDCYYWQKTKGTWKKDQKMTLRNWVKNDAKWKNERKGGYFQQ